MNFLIYLEKKYPVEEWKVNEVCVWPYLRNKLYFLLNLEIEKEKRIKNYQRINARVNKKFNKYYKLVTSFVKFNYFFFFLKKKKFLFFEASTHRILFRDVTYNKFYDTIINECNLEKESYIFNYLNEGKKKFESRNIRYNIFEQLEYYNNYKKFFKTKRTEEAFRSFDSFFDEFKRYNFSNNFLNSFSEKGVKNSVFSIYQKSLFFDKIFKKMQPKEIFILCYYNNLNTYAIVLAAERMGIKLIEMQHGPQTNIQSSYSNWTKVTENNFKMLPRSYWNWDYESKKVIDKWSNNLTNFNAFVGGNAWVDYWNYNSHKFKFKFNNYILYTLQSLSLDLLFPESIIKLIKDGKYLWMIRLHPRQLAEKNNIVNFLKNKNIIENINIEEATSFPLPLLLKKCIVNVTHYSGTVNEAVMMNKTSILLDKLGVSCFEEFVNDKKAIYVSPDEFSDKIIQKILVKNQELVSTNNLKSECKPFYKEYFNNK